MIERVTSIDHLSTKPGDVVVLRIDDATPAQIRDFSMSADFRDLHARFQGASILLANRDGLQFDEADVKIRFAPATEDADGNEYPEPRVTISVVLGRTELRYQVAFSAVELTEIVQWCADNGRARLHLAPSVRPEPAATE